MQTQSTSESSTSSSPFAAAAGRSRDADKSPALALFRQNPFRVLRLSVESTAQEALWKGEKLKTLVRADIDDGDGDLTPWLKRGDEIDLQHAMQALEEPMKRIVEQLSWFDFTRDAHGGLLEKALLEQNADGLAEYLDVSADDDGIPARLNRANLRLLLGFSRMHGTGPQAADANAAAGADKTAALSFSSSGGLSAVNEPHLLLFAAGSTDAWVGLVEAGVRDWEALLDDDAFEIYVNERIAFLADDRLVDEDAEAIAAALRTRLADLMAGEMKQSMVGGRSLESAALAGVVSGSSFDAASWGLSLRPLRHVFERELQELNRLVDDSGPANVDDVDLFLRRLARVRARWERLDTQGLLGLAAIVDDAVVRAFDRLRTIEVDVGAADGLRKALERARTTAHSDAIKERVKAYANSFEEYMKHGVCAYCRKREYDPDNAVMLTGQMVTGVTHSYNTVTTHYKLQGAAIPRCLACADYQLFQKKLSWLAAFAAAVVIPLVLYGSRFGLEGAMVIATATVGAGFGAAALARWLMAREAGDGTSNKSAEQSEAGQRLRGDGYKIVKVDIEKKAVSRWVAVANPTSPWVGIVLLIIGAYIGCGILFS